MNEARGRPTVVIIDDAPENITILGEALGEDCEIRFALNGADGLRIAKESGADLVLLDIVMPGIDGYEVCRDLKGDEDTSGIPIIFITAKTEIEDEAWGLSLGAVDYITKPFSIPVVKARVRAHLELKAKKDLLEKLANVDGLTGITNRRGFDDALDREWRRAFRATSWLSLILIDVDYFKAFNDHYGHPSGDDCLRKVAVCVSEMAPRAGDVVARYGGEELAILLPGSGTSGAMEVAKRVRQGIRALGIEHVGSQVAPVLTVSVGVASTIPSTGSGPEALVRAADDALYESKNAGRDCIRSKTWT